MKRKLAAIAGAAALVVGVVAAPASADPGNGCGVGPYVSAAAHQIQDVFGVGLGAFFHQAGGNPAQGIPGDGGGIQALHADIKAAGCVQP